jgi:hypothetical protein
VTRWVGSSYRSRNGQSKEGEDVAELHVDCGGGCLVDLGSFEWKFE